MKNRLVFMFGSILVLLNLASKAAPSVKLDSTNSIFLGVFDGIFPIPNSYVIYPVKDPSVFRKLFFKEHDFNSGEILDSNLFVGDFGDDGGNIEHHLVEQGYDITTKLTCYGLTVLKFNTKGLDTYVVTNYKEHIFIVSPERLWFINSLDVYGYKTGLKCDDLSKRSLDER